MEENEPNSELSNETPSEKTLPQWVEITDQFNASVQDLELGELLHDDMFGLFEAMSAIEMMDPKMDAGMLCNRGFKRIRSFEQAVNDGILPLSDLSNSTLLGIIDGTLARIASWLEGHSLAQTVFTCIYLHRPYAVQDPILRTFCLAMYKFLDVIKDLLHRALVYEEEDFQPMQYGFHLNPEISETRMIGMLREIEEELHKKIRSKQAQADTNEEHVALYARIKFLRIFLQVFGLLRKDDQVHLGDCQRMLQNGLEVLQIMKDTIHLGEGFDNETENIICFEPSINQRLLPPTFPRYTKIKKRKEAILHFIEIMENIKVVCKVEGLTSFHQALDFFTEFSQSGLCLVSRSALQLVGRNSGTSKEALREALKTFCNPPSLSVRASADIRQVADSFLVKASRAASLLLQLSGFNRARQRDKLAILLEELTQLQEEAERADALIIVGTSPKPYFATWVLYHTYRAQVLYLLAGFELELYAEHEYYYIYWYLYECVYGWLISALSRADSLIQESNNAANTNKNRRTKSSKASRKGRPHTKDALRMQALQQLSGGYFKALLGLLREELLQAPLPGYDRERVRFEHRFCAFTRLPAPPFATYRDFRTAAQAASAQGSEELFLSASRHFLQASHLLESNGDSLAVTAKKNYVLVKLLAAGHRPKYGLIFCFEQNKHFPMIKMNDNQAS